MQSAQRTRRKEGAQIKTEKKPDSKESKVNVVTSKDGDEEDNSAFVVLLWCMHVTCKIRIHGSWTAERPTT